jgi:hypothetical protein
MTNNVDYTTYSSLDYLEEFLRSKLCIVWFRYVRLF